MESEQQRLTHEARDLEFELREVLVQRQGDEVLKAELEKLAGNSLFRDYTWLWGPVVYGRNRKLFRAFVLTHFSMWALGSEGKYVDAWEGEGALSMEWWLDAADKVDDVELFRRLHSWRLSRLGWRQMQSQWRKDVLERFQRATSRMARRTTLEKVDIKLLWLDEPTALSLYEVDAEVSRPFILAHLPPEWLPSGAGGSRRRLWQVLLERAWEVGDKEFHYAVYRRLVPAGRWREDVLALCQRVQEPAALQEELVARHLETAAQEPGVVATTLVELAERRGADVMPYLVSTARAVFPRAVWEGEVGNAPRALLERARREGWLELWAALLCHGAPQAAWQAEVEQWVGERHAEEGLVRERLRLLAGAGEEQASSEGPASPALPLEDRVALALYERLPDLLMESYLVHLSSESAEGYPRLAQAALERKDEQLVDVVAGRAALQSPTTLRPGSGWAQVVERLAEYYGELPLEDGTFARRAAAALALMPPYALGEADWLAQDNRLARLLLERSAQYYLAQGATAVRELLESPLPTVQALAYRLLGLEEEQARALAARHVERLLPALVQPMHRRLRSMALGALRNAASEDVGMARQVLEAVSEALSRSEGYAHRDSLTELRQQVHERWPALRDWV